VAVAVGAATAVVVVVVVVTGVGWTMARTAAEARGAVTARRRVMGSILYSVRGGC
jgi:hypothetical protein